MNQRFDRDSELMIDAVRGLAALMVLVTHCFDLAVVDVFSWNPTASPEVWRWARASAGHGGFFVWCFFMISGLCIHRSITRGMAARVFDWRGYALARVTRIYPLFLLGLALAVVAWLLHEDWGPTPAEHPWPNFFASLLSLQILTKPFPSFDTSWSLSCEMIYYGLWPVLLVLAGTVSRATWLALGAAVAGLAGTWFLSRQSARLEHSTALEGVWIVAVLFPVWVCGAWLAANWDELSARISRKIWVISVILCGLAEVLLVVAKYYQFPVWAVHLVSWSSVPGLLIFLAGARNCQLSRYSWSGPVCRWLGQFSYPCYILHMQLLLILNHFLVRLLPRSVSTKPLLLFCLLFLPLFLLVALIGPPLERVFMKWRSALLAAGTNRRLATVGQV